MVRISQHASARQGSVYLAVVGTAILVSLIGFTSLHVARVELKMTSAKNERTAADRLALSSVEFALGRIAIAPSTWRGDYEPDQEYTVNPSAIRESLTFKILYSPTDPRTTDSTEPVEIQGIGRCGDATVVYSVDYAASTTTEQQTALVVESYDGATSTESNVGATNYLGEYFVANLPAETISWSLTSVDLYLKGHGAVSATLDVKFYNADGSGQPDTLIESVSVYEGLLPAGNFGWYSVNFGSATGLAPGAGFCLALESVTGGNAATVPYQTGLSETDSHLLRGGNGIWYTPDNTQSIKYRIHGVYTTSVASGDFVITPGSWRRREAP